MLVLKLLRPWCAVCGDLVAFCPGKAPLGLGTAAGLAEFREIGPGGRWRLELAWPSDELRDKGKDGVMLVLGLGVQLCRRGTDLLCYFGLIQVSVQNLGLIVWLSSCCCNCRLFRGGWAGCVQHLATTLIKVTELLRDQMMTNKFTFIQFSLAGFVPSSLIFPAKGSVYFPWNGRGPATQSSFKNKPLKRKTKEKEPKSDNVRLYRADPDSEFQAARARGLFKCNTISTIFGWFETLLFSLLCFQKTIKKENCPSCQKEELQRFNT